MSVVIWRCLLELCRGRWRGTRWCGREVSLGMLGVVIGQGYSARVAGGVSVTDGDADAESDGDADV